MWSWLRRRFHRRPSGDELLNEGLGLALNWGESWLSPIQGRLGALHPDLGAGELEALDATCRGALRLALDTVHAMMAGRSRTPSAEALATVVRARYPWVDEDNLERLLRQGTYYAAKMGGHGRDD